MPPTSMCEVSRTHNHNRNNHLMGILNYKLIVWCLRAAALMKHITLCCGLTIAEQTHTCLLRLANCQTHIVFLVWFMTSRAHSDPMVFALGSFTACTSTRAPEFQSIIAFCDDDDRLLLLFYLQLQVVMLKTHQNILIDVECLQALTNCIWTKERIISWK